MEKDLQYYKEAYSELETIFEMAFDQITVADGDGVFLRVSSMCGDNFGMPNEEIVGSSAYELEEKGIFDKSATVAVLEEKKEITVFQMTGAKRKLMVTGKPIFDEKGNVKRVINISRDITELENLKQQIRDQEDMVDTMRSSCAIRTGSTRS